MAENRKGIKWSRDETILAFELYCRTPFRKIGEGNPDIIKLAKLLGRTPGSVALKMSNLAHFDPELRKRGIKGMSHGSRLDKEIYDEFENDWNELSYQAAIITAKMENKVIDAVIDFGDIDGMPEGEYKESLRKIRVGQYFFRSAILNSYGNKCCITGIKESQLLVAKHIKPWNVSNEKTERFNPRNGLCLNSLHGRAFGKGFITIDSEYKIVFSRRMREVEMDRETRNWFWSYKDAEIMLPDKFLPGKNFIEYHNDMIFQR